MHATQQRDFVIQVQAALEAAAEPALAPAMSAYMLNQFMFLGIQTPRRRALTMALIKGLAGPSDRPAQMHRAVIDAATRLWALPAREYQYVACDLLMHHQARLQPSDLPELEALVQQRPWWDSVDQLAKVVGAVVHRHPELQARMDELIASPNTWLRRVALLHQLNWRHDTDEARLFRYCLACAGETEFFIRKAIGWALRQYARSQPESVRQFLARHGHQLAPLSRREAGKHLIVQ